MSSLRRILSLDSTDLLAAPHHSHRPKFVRHSSLPILTLFNKPQSLSLLPLPMCRSRVGDRHHERSSSSSSAVHCFCRTGGNKSDDHHICPSPVPAWLASDHIISVVPRSLSMKKNLDVKESIVYQELLQSIRTLEAEPPNRYVGLVNPQPGAATLQANESQQQYSEDVTGRPLSLRMLKRNGQRTRPEVSSLSSAKLNPGKSGHEIPLVLSSGQGMESLLSDNGGPVNRAFASMVFMMESLQQHILWLKRTLVSEADACLHDMLSKVQAEMQETFLWLFQKVYVYTPKLMLLTMMLLVDFTAHSMGAHVAMAVMPMGEPPTAAVEREVTAPTCTFDKHLSWTEVSTQQGPEPGFVGGGEGNGSARILKVGGDMNGETLPVSSLDGPAMTKEEDSYGGFDDGTPCNYCTLRIEEEDKNYHDLGFCRSDFSEEYHILNDMWKQVKDSSERHGVVVSRHMLVAPVRAPELEADDYACYDRTDLNYQHELSRDPANPLLLANYAQFLHVVRHDHDRADELYKRAVRADPVDGEVMGRYASFLWVAKEDMEAADKAYRAALAVDASNAFHAGSYANFMWNSGAGHLTLPPPYLHTNRSQLPNQ